MNMNENLESNTHTFQYGRSNKIDLFFTLDLMHGLQSSFLPFDFQALYKVACSNTLGHVNTREVVFFQPYHQGHKNLT